MSRHYNIRLSRDSSVPKHRVFPVYAPKGIRTPVTALKGRCPGPLDYGGFLVDRASLVLIKMLIADNGMSQHIIQTKMISWVARIYCRLAARSTHVMRALTDTSRSAHHNWLHPYRMIDTRYPKPLIKWMTCYKLSMYAP